jgi:hypothetical protein
MEVSEYSEVWPSDLTNELPPMPAGTEMPGPLRNCCDRWSEWIAEMKTDADRIHCIRAELPELLLNHSVWTEILENIVRGCPYLNVLTDLFHNEILLYTEPRGAFSIHLYFHPAGQHTIIHDHNAWGVSGAPFGELSVIKYRREDNGTVEGFALLTESGRRFLEPGEVDVTLPLEKGIHQTGSPHQEMNVMVSVYGRPIRRLFINEFDLAANRVRKLYPPKLQKKMLARAAYDILTSEHSTHHNSQKPPGLVCDRYRHLS